MATLSELLQIGLQHHQTGRLDAAAQSYRQIFEVDPNQAGSNVGLTAAMAGDLDEYVEVAFS